MKTLTQNENKSATPSVVCERDYLIPNVNIFETTEGYVLEAEMPGVSKGNLEVTIEGQQLTLLGRRADAVSADDVIYRESNTADFRRVFELDPAIDAPRITARIDQGVVTLHLPKAEIAKPRQISITE